MRRGSWGFADVLDHLIEMIVDCHDGLLGRKCGQRRGGICVFLGVSRSEVGRDCGTLIGREGLNGGIWDGMGQKTWASLRQEGDFQDFCASAPYVAMLRLGILNNNYMN